MQKIFEPIIHILYFTSVILMGSYMLRNSIGDRYHKVFGSLAITLGLGDAIYLIPRMYSILTTGLEDNSYILSWGRMGNSVIFTIFFMILYDAFNERFNKKKNVSLDRTIYVLALIRILLIIVPIKQWLNTTPSSTYVLMRYIPLALMGLLLILVMYLHGKKYRDTSIKLISVLLFFTIIFMEPLLFFPKESIWLLVFTIIRTILLMLIVFVGYKELREQNVLSRY